MKISNIHPINEPSSYLKAHTDNFVHDIQKQVSRAFASFQGFFVHRIRLTSTHYTVKSLYFPSQTTSTILKTDLIHKSFLSDNERYQKEVCEGETMKIQCPLGKRIEIVSATYQQQGSSICAATRGSLASCKPVRVSEKTKRMCDGERACSISANSNKFGYSCPDVTKQLQFEYLCYKEGAQNP